MIDFFSFFSDLPLGSYGLIAASVIAFIRYFFFDRRDEQEAETMMRKNYQREVKKVIREREKRNVKDHLMSEDEFWKLVEDAKSRSKENYRHQCGLLKDTFNAMEPVNLLEFQGTYLVQSMKANTFKLAGAFYIISNSVAFYEFDHFKDWLISKGQVQFNNYVENPEWIANANFNRLDGEGIYNALSEVYFAKVGKLLPEVADFDYEFKGEKIEEREVADRFPKLWEKFLIN